MDDKATASQPSTPSPCTKTTAMLQGIATATSGCISEKYFNALVSSLSKELDMETVLVGELTKGEQPSIQTKAAIVNKTLTNNFSYKLAGTPCENTLDKKSSCYPESVQQAFPSDDFLKDMGIESYIGAALLSSSGSPMGILVA